jgi:hypothetical protein
MLQWIETHPGLAAWVQAIGAILAIFVALLVVFLQQRLERNSAARERRERAIGLGILLHTDLVALQGAIERTARDGVLESEVLKVPASIVQYADQFYLLGTAGHALLQMISTINAVAAQKFAFHASDRTGNPIRDEVRQNLNDSLRHAFDACSEAVAGLDLLMKSTR